MPTAPPPNAQPWEPTKLVAWLDRIEGAIDRLNLFELLELPATGSGEHVQLAYHQIARTRHPDLFRGRLTARDAERLMRVYGRIAAAYASLRDPNERTRYIYELRQQRGRTSSIPPAATAAVGRTPTPTPPAVGRTPTAPVPGRPAAAPDRPRTSSPLPARGAPLSTPPPLGAAPRLPSVPAAQLAPRALAFYRRAESALASGDVAAATLNLRMALSADPTSELLRDALAEVQRHGK
jgi:curved DNA-binding protein CbpA